MDFFDLVEKYEAQGLSPNKAEQYAEMDLMGGNEPDGRCGQCGFDVCSCDR